MAYFILRLEAYANARTGWFLFLATAPICRPMFHANS